ncbi:MAG: hypothetical protein ACI4F8_05235 [Lachnospiraceae bacterium]
MRAKQYLQQIEKIDKIIQNKIIEKEQWFAIATNTTSQIGGERVQSSVSQQKMADATERYFEISQEIDRYIDSLINTKKEVISTIEQLPPTEYDVLHKVYIGIIVSDDDPKMVRYLSLEEVADMYKKSYPWATSVHGRALKHVQDILDERKNDNE